MPVGLSNTFTVVFLPPTNAPLEYHQDKVVVKGTNLPAGFAVNLYALVTSSQRGNIQFFVDNILAQPVPNATVRVKNTLLQEEYVARTDANGYVIVSDLQEGPWAWQATASGHATRSGVIDVAGNQTVLLSTRLAKSLVTVNFSVVPVPFTDRYEIVVEQTFETHVPAPVLVVDPPLLQFHEINSPFEATFIARVKNEGLIQMTDVQISGGYTTGARLVPLINYFPLLRAQETVEVPFRFVFDDGSQNVAPPEPQNLATGGKKKPGGDSFVKSLGPQIDENGNITPSNIQFPENYGQPNQGGNGCTGGIFDLDNFFGAIKAIVSACAQCVDAATLNAVVSGLQVAFDKAKDKGKFDYWQVIETVVQIYELFGCPGGGIGGGNGGGGGGSSGDGGPGTFTQYGGGGGACFIAGTEVLLADGSMRVIEEIKVGDRVRTGAHKSQVATVAEVLSRDVTHTFDIEFAASGVIPVSTAALPSRVRASAEHLFWVDGEGWVAARNLKAGQWLLTPEDLRVQIRGVTRVDEPARVYTFGNRGDNAFYANGILVRDSCGDKSPYFRKPDPGAAQAARVSSLPAGTEVAR
jgi:hypothetical protein